MGRYMKELVDMKQMRGAILGAVVLASLLFGLWHLIERGSPRMMWYSYIDGTPIPKRTEFLRGKNPDFRSFVFRHFGIEMRREDRLYCEDGVEDISHVLPEQRRPAEGTTYIPAGMTRTIRAYYLPIPENMISCRMCGTATGFTPLGYKKRQTYCSKSFGVNK